MVFAPRQYEVSHNGHRVTVTATRAYNAAVAALPEATVFAGRLEQPVTVDRGYGETVRAQWSFGVAGNGYRVWVTEI